MALTPVRLGKTALPQDKLSADRKDCKRFGPCGVGHAALYLNSYFLDCRYYIALQDVRRVFKRVAMSKGGFTGSGLFGSIPYLVVEYGDGTEKQCTFKREEDVDSFLDYLSSLCPHIPTHSVQAEHRLAQKAQEEAHRYLEQLSPDAQGRSGAVGKSQGISGRLSCPDRPPLRSCQSKAGQRTHQPLSQVGGSGYRSGRPDRRGLWHHRMAASRGFRHLFHIAGAGSCVPGFPARR